MYKESFATILATTADVGTMSLLTVERSTPSVDSPAETVSETDGTGREGGREGGRVRACSSTVARDVVRKWSVLYVLFVLIPFARERVWGA